MKVVAPRKAQSTAKRLAGAFEAASRPAAGSCLEQCRLAFVSKNDGDCEKVIRQGLRSVAHTENQFPDEPSLGQEDFHEQLVPAVTVRRMRASLLRNFIDRPSSVCGGTRAAGLFA
jgi:hypothetical protein